jgi:DNA (cytosine-5)-methyltransferase 1
MRSIELFSGAGGLALGLEAAGFEHVALVEKNKDACATLRLNRPRWNLLETDVRAIRFADYDKVEMVAGGPPCQPFSIGGKARGYDDSRDMFPQAVRAVRELHPRAFMFENVRGLLRQTFQNYVEYIRLQLTYPDYPLNPELSWDANLQLLQKHHTSRRHADGLTYQVSIHLADAANYGVPQRRHRVFFVGFRSDLDAKWSFPTPVCSAENLYKEKYITGEYWKNHGIPIPNADTISSTLNKRNFIQTEIPLTSCDRWKTVRDALRGLDAPNKKSRYANHIHPLGAKAYSGHTGSRWDDPAKALKAGAHGVPGGENMLTNDNGEARYFSVRESARIQTFPDEYIFSGSWSESMRQLGNAVPVTLAQTVASSIHTELKKLHE